MLWDFQEKYSIKTALSPAEKSQRCQEPRNVRVTGDFKYFHTRLGIYHTPSPTKTQLSSCHK